ncbi:site-specific integrase [Candidatus Igneacidithiobacillus taiwanensis]|uniref:site-specific integrase n=1 Tax=Candidatus Igneacidithiobacillus taiwanensis TaxID=1945924 RepID=UPI003916CEED
MISAGRQWLQRSGISYSSVATLSQRWSDFARFAKDNDVGSMERITKDLVQSYADHLIDCGLSASSIQNRLSAIKPSCRQRPRVPGSRCLHDLWGLQPDRMFGRKRPKASIAAL